MLKLKFRVVLVSSIIVFGGLTHCTSNKSKAPVLPIEDFFKNPDKTEFKLSPNGTHIAFLMPWKNRMNVFVQDVKGNTAVRVTESAERDILNYFWGNNERIVYLKDIKGDDKYRLYSVDINGSHNLDLTPFNNVRVWVIDELKNIADEMIISMNKRNPRIFDAYRINIETGKIRMAAKNPGNVTKWLTDNEGKIRLAVQTDGVNVGILYRDNEIEKFKLAAVTDFREEISPLFFTFDNKFVYACSNRGRDKCALVKYDIKNDKELEVIFEHPEVDAWYLLKSYKRKKITGAAFTTWKKEAVFFDDERKNLQKIVEQKIPGIQADVVNMNRDEDKVLIKTYSDKSLGAYYYYDLKNNDFRKLASKSPWIKEEYMADMKPISYKTRDGFTIHGYLTLPNGVKPINLPAVIIPHGGPWKRDMWGFNNEVQFLANRGYAVLQMNFRGSIGYGKKFWHAGFKQWGLKMEDDITDGVNWLIKQQIADPERIAIYGASYGGFAALSGLMKTPDLYACGVSYVGLIDIVSFLKSIPPYWKPFQQMLYEIVGDPVKDSVILKQVSPYLHPDKFTKPVFIAQGANDSKVPLEKADEFVAALKKEGVTVKYMVKKNEGHGFKNEENRLDFYRELESFLADNLKGRKYKR